jgi:hypothetical protein
MSTENRQLAGRVVPDPIEDMQEPSEGIAAKLAAYHAARAQGFYLATMEHPGAITDFVSPLLYEATLAGIYFDLAETDEPNPDRIAFENAASMRNPEGIGPFIYQLLEWANVDPESIAPFQHRRAS